MTYHTKSHPITLLQIDHINKFLNLKIKFNMPLPFVLLFNIVNPSFNSKNDNFTIFKLNKLH